MCGAPGVSHNLTLACIEKVPAQSSHRSLFYVFPAGTGQQTRINKRSGNADYVLSYGRRRRNSELVAVLSQESQNHLSQGGIAATMPEAFLLYLKDTI